MVFSNPNCATAFDTQGSEPYGLLRLLKRKGYLTPFPLCVKPELLMRNMLVASLARAHDESRQDDDESYHCDHAVDSNPPKRLRTTAAATGSQGWKGVVEPPQSFGCVGFGF